MGATCPGHLIHLMTRYWVSFIQWIIHSYMHPEKVTVHLVRIRSKQRGRGENGVNQQSWKQSLVKETLWLPEHCSFNMTWAPLTHVFFLNICLPGILKGCGTLKWEDPEVSHQGEGRERFHWASKSCPNILLVYCDVNSLDPWTKLLRYRYTFLTMMGKTMSQNRCFLPQGVSVKYWLWSRWSESNWHTESTSHRKKG